MAILSNPNKLQHNIKYTSQKDKQLMNIERCMSLFGVLQHLPPPSAVVWKKAARKFFYMLININCPWTVTANLFDAESKGTSSEETKKVSHGWFHTALIQSSAHWECERVTGTGIKLQDSSSKLYCGQLACWWMTTKKFEKEISHRQELAGVQFSCSVSNGFLIRVKPSWWAVSQIEISFPIWRNLHPLVQQIYGRPVPGLLFLRVAPKACAPLRLDNTTRLTDQRWAGENKGPELSQAALALPSNSVPFSGKDGCD